MRSFQLWKRARVHDAHVDAGTRATADSRNSEAKKAKIKKLEGIRTVYGLCRERKIARASELASHYTSESELAAVHARIGWPVRCVGRVVGRHGSEQFARETKTKTKTKGKF